MSNACLILRNEVSEKGLWGTLSEQEVHQEILGI